MFRERISLLIKLVGPILIILIAFLFFFMSLCVLSALGPKGLEPNYYSILLYSILFYSILFYSILFYSILFYSIYSILSFCIISTAILLRINRYYRKFGDEV